MFREVLVQIQEIDGGIVRFDIFAYERQIIVDYHKYDEIVEVVE